MIDVFLFLVILGIGVSICCSLGDRYNLTTQLEVVPHFYHYTFSSVPDSFTCKLSFSRLAVLGHPSRGKDLRDSFQNCASSVRRIWSLVLYVRLTFSLLNFNICVCVFFFFLLFLFQTFSSLSMFCILKNWCCFCNSYFLMDFHQFIQNKCLFGNMQPKSEW